MSALYVRQTFRAWAQEVSPLVAVSFYDTVNREPKPADLTWWTCSFFAETMEGETFCGPGYLESGIIRLFVMSQPGQGDEVAVDVLEQLVRHLFDQQDPTQRLVLTQFEPVLEDSAGSADRYYRVGCFLNYRLSL